MNGEEIMARLKQINDVELEKEGADFEALTAEVNKLLAEKDKIKRKAELKERTEFASNFVAKPELKDNDEMIERKAFMDFVQTGVMSDVLKRADVTGTSTDLGSSPGVIIPQHVVNEIITAINKITGRLYSVVKKTNLKGGVEYPKGDFSATFTRIAENGPVSDTQKGGSITGSVSFKYQIGEIRLSRTLLQTVLSVPMFEAELAKVIAEAYVKAMDDEILNGKVANKQMEGILSNASNYTAITMSPKEMADWKTWQKKVFAKLPLSMRNAPYEIVMSAGTYESNIKTLADDNNRPVYNETYSPQDGALDCRFKGRKVMLVEPQLFPDFDDCAVNGAFAMIWIPDQAYAINSNMDFTVRTYWDEATNKQITKALVINDGHPIRTDMIYIIKKVADPSQ